MNKTEPMPKPLAIPSSTEALYALCMSLLYDSMACFSPLNEITCFTEEDSWCTELNWIPVGLAGIQIAERIELTVFMAASVSSTTLPASLYDACPLLESLYNTFDRTPPAMTTGGMQDRMTRDRSQPFTNAMTKPPMKLATSCINLPTCRSLWLRKLYKF